MSNRIGKMIFVALDSIEPNPFNFRLDLGADSLQGLAASINEQGLIHPVLLRPHPDPTRVGQYQLVCGERRFSAVKLLAQQDPDTWRTIPARVEALDDTAALAAMLQENELRQDWTPFEKAAFFRAIYDDAHFASIRKMAVAFDIGLTTLHRYLRVFDLPESIVRYFRAGELTIADMEVILEAPDDVRQELADHLATHVLNKAQARRLARQLQEGGVDWIDSATSALSEAACECTVSGSDELKLVFNGGSASELAEKLQQAASSLRTVDAA